jgi:hypothetical protein
MKQSESLRKSVEMFGRGALNVNSMLGLIFRERSKVFEKTNRFRMTHFFCKLRVRRHEGAFGLFCRGQVTERLKVLMLKAEGEK